MIKVVACFEKGWFDSRTDFRLWDHLCRSFSADLQLIDYLSEMDVPKDYELVVVDESAGSSLSDFVHPKNAVYLFGKTSMNKIQDNVKHDWAVKIETPARVCNFGVTAAAMVLYDRMMKE